MTKHWQIGAATVALVGLVACSSSAPAPAGGATKTSSIQNSCINPVEIEKQDIVSDNEIRFTMRGGDVWVNKLNHACFGLKSEGGFEWTIHGTLACSNQQIIKVLRLDTSCSLGEFTNLGKQPKTHPPV